MTGLNFLVRIAPLVTFAPVSHDENRLDIAESFAGSAFVNWR
ncbi:MAG: hypothetical protein ABSG80_13065 [Verrucomicrobiota bacterium]